MENVILILTTGILMIASFVLGATFANHPKQNKKGNVPSASGFVESIVKGESKKEVKRMEKQLSTIMQNIENYDGSSAGQKDVGR